MDSSPASDLKIRQALLGAMGKRCVALETLATELSAAEIALGPHDADRLGRILDDSTDFVELDAGWIGVAAHLNGTRWITAVNADDANEDVLDLDPDLALLNWWSIGMPLTLGDTGVELNQDHSEHLDDVLFGPPGWLDEYSGANVEIHVIGTQLHFAPAPLAPESLVTNEIIIAVQEIFEQHARSAELRDAFGTTPIDLTQMSAEDVLWELLVTYPGIFQSQAIPPIDTMIDAAGLMRVDNTIMRCGSDPNALHRWHGRNRLAAFHHLEAQQVDFAELVIATSDAAISGTAIDHLPSEQRKTAALVLALALDDPAVCKAVLGHHLQEHTDVAALARFAHDYAAHSDGEGAGLRWLEGRAWDLAGDSRQALTALESAVDTGEEHGPSLIALASFRADAGDAIAAVALLRRADVDDPTTNPPGPDNEVDDLYLEVAGYARIRPPAAAERNDRCPCGSGRKYKACHLGNERHSLTDRAPWLYDKARRFIREHERELLATIASEAARASRRGHQFLIELIDSALVADIALCEGGVGEMFVAQRDAILPDDEALLAAHWQLSERSLFEVERANDISLMLRDLRTGDRITVTNTNASSATRRGDLMLGRPLPVGDTWRAYSGFVKVGGALRDEMLDALDEHDPYVIAELIGRCLAPPQVCNSDNEPLEFHDLTWLLFDPAAARRALDSSDELSGDGDKYQLVRDSANQPRTIIMTLTLDGDSLRGEVNSLRRSSEAITLIATLLPNAELVDHDVRDFDEAMAAGTALGEPNASNSFDDPELAEIREQFILDYEQQWLDNTVPALRGLTPREAAVDPIGRLELERLLDSFPSGAGLMNATRLRHALGL